MKRKLISLLLCLCMLLSVLSVTANADHVCTDEDGDYCCDLCGSIVDHICFSEEGNYWCDVCFGPYGHDCVDQDGDYWCDLCYEILPHTCGDEDGDYCCDICCDPYGHDCIDEDEDAWCDLCENWLEHVCIDEDGDYWCDLCDDVIDHECIDGGRDGWCDLCELWIIHDCGDTDGDGLCDDCSENLVAVDIIVNVTSYLDDTASVKVVLYPTCNWSTDSILTGNSTEHIFEDWGPDTYYIEVRKPNHTPFRSEVFELFYQDLYVDVQLCPIGDVTRDGDVNIADAGRIYAHVRDTSAITDDYARKCADASQDREISIVDVAKVYAHARGTAPLW